MYYQEVIIGAGGMGRELFSALRLAGRSPFGFLDDAPSEETLACLARLGAEHLGPVDSALSLRKPYYVAIGNPEIRARIDRRLRGASVVTAPAFIDATATIGHDVDISEGSIICARSIVTTNVRIGRCVIVNNGCSVSHDVHIGDYATLAPMCSLCGHVKVLEGAELGTCASVLPRMIVGSWSMTGAGAVITKPVPSMAVVVGVPARIIKTRN